MKNIIKKLDSTIAFISNFQQEVTISELPFEDRKAKLVIEDRSLRLDMTLSSKEAMNNFNLVDFDRFLITQLNGDKYVVPERNGFLEGTMNLEKENNDMQEYHIKLSQMMDERWCAENEYYYRFLMPIHNVYWIQDINTCWYQYGKNSCRGLLEVNFHHAPIQLFPVKVGAAQYLVIESQNPCTYDAIQKYLYVISLALGFVTSVVTFDYAYIIACNSLDFEDDLLCGFEEMIPSIKGQYRFFTTNMYVISDSLKRNHVEYALMQLYNGDELNSHLQDWMQINEFQNLVLMLHDNDDLARAVLILIESSSMSLDYQGAICAVALETICSALEKSSDKSFLEQKKWQTKVRPEFEHLIVRLKEQNVISEDHERNMLNKLNSFNMESNKNKLSMPFSHLGYSLSKQELEVIKGRDCLLHGHILGHSHEESFQKIMYVCLELQKLCAILLFRKSGFKGLLVNNAVLMGLEKAIKAKEPVLV